MLPRASTSFPGIFGRRAVGIDDERVHPLDDDDAAQIGLGSLGEAPGEKAKGVSRPLRQRDEFIVLDAVDAYLRAAHGLRRRKRRHREADAPRLLDGAQAQIGDGDAQPVARALIGARRPTR